MYRQDVADPTGLKGVHGANHLAVSTPLLKEEKKPVVEFSMYHTYIFKITKRYNGKSICQDSR
jgi:hypothetical protein